MKNLFALLCCLALLLCQANAQKWVSTNVENKNAILEEFTGIHCGYCPDGHRIATELAKTNPGRVFLVNIHAGNYAVPGTGELDLRTTQGTAIDAASNNTLGYPAGTVNRSTNPWAKNRGEWANLVAGILTQQSPVNVAVKSFVDFTKRELVTEVELYYTSNSPASTNYLTVMLTQSNILGTQSDGGFNPTNWTIADKKYRHNHALRQMISSGGAFGEKIDTTTKGHYEYRKYVTALPDKITNIDVLMFNLEVVAFVSETQSNIYTGAGTEVEYDQNLKVDIGLQNTTDVPNYCFTSINPKVEVTNNSGTQTISSFDVSVFINGVQNKKTFTGSLAKGEKTTIDWGAIPVSTIGAYTIAFETTPVVNGNLNDMDFRNDSYISSGLRFKSKAFSNYLAGFDVTTTPANLAFDTRENPNFNIFSTSKCGANNTQGAVRYALHSSWGVSGKPGPILFGEADLSKLSYPCLTYYYAYSADNFGGTPPVVKVIVSEDCGANWNEINSVTCTETGKPATPGNWYIPTSAQYIMVSIPLSAYRDKSILFKVVGIPGTAGNAMYIDEITISENLGVDEAQNEMNYSVYPNPATDGIQFNNDIYIGKDYSIYSVIGTMVASGTNQDNKIDVTKLNPGFYYIKINNELLKFVKN